MLPFKSSLASITSISGVVEDWQTWWGASSCRVCGSCLLSVHLSSHHWSRSIWNHLGHPYQPHSSTQSDADSSDYPGSCCFSVGGRIQGERSLWEVWEGETPKFMAVTLSYFNFESKIPFILVIYTDFCNFVQFLYEKDNIKSCKNFCKTASICQKIWKKWVKKVLVFSFLTFFIGLYHLLAGCSTRGCRVRGRDPSQQQSHDQCS